ncbi:MAG: hypothetical protein BWY09_02301 [Candidatus Hydrogenedentes bacterium ADurb.Bin179]|nr:MAG: hypothetical protein BWY09_02301 [Candidatus Hydrogenedentes bacterium ADurb.Bin179]
MTYSQVIEGIRILSLLVVACDYFNGTFQVLFRPVVVSQLQVDLPETGVGRYIVRAFIQGGFVVLHIIKVRVAELFQFQAREV